MSFASDCFQKIAQSLYPKGRAFNMPLPENDTYKGGILYKLHRALNKSNERLYNDARSTFDSILPDNNNFTADDATAWERRLGITTSNTDLATRKQAIQRKMNYPGSNAPRQSAIRTQEQLQAAGFDVYVYENIFPDGIGGYMTRLPGSFIGQANQKGAMSGYFQSGQYQFAQTVASLGRKSISGYFQSGQNQFGEMGPLTITKIANHIEDDKDTEFDIGDNLRSTFFIGGYSLGEYAIVPTDRHDEFRQLILTIKPVQTVGFLFITYQ